MAISKRKRTQLERSVARYIDQTLSGKRIAGKLEQRALQRQVDDLKEQRHTDYVFSWEHAQLFCDWCECSKHAVGTAAGEQFQMHVTQQVTYSILYGWRRRDDNGRRFRKAYISKARGNGKSPEAARVATYGFLLDGKVGAEIVCAATKRAQAQSYVYEPAVKILEQFPELKPPILQVYKSPHEARLEIDGTIGKLYPLGRDSSNDGGNYHLVIRDESHAMTRQHSEFNATLVTGLKSADCLLMDITTAGNDRSEIWIPLYDYACKVLNGVVIDPTYFAMIFQIDDDDDPFAHGMTWRRAKRMLQKANPLLDVAIESDVIHREWQEAMAIPTHRNKVTRYRFNRRVSAREKLVEPEVWQLGDDDLSNLEGLPCHGGLDMGLRNDLAAFWMCFETDNDDEPDVPFYEFTGRAWICEETERDLTEEPFASWIREGRLVVTPGDTTDHRAIIAYILECAERYKLLTVAGDPNHARLLLTELVEEGLQVFEFRQNCTAYNEPLELLLSALLEHRVRHGGDPLLAWAADNAIGKTNAAGHTMPDKANSVEKIDPFVSALMAFSECLFSDAEDPESYYEANDIRTV